MRKGTCAFSVCSPVRTYAAQGWEEEGKRNLHLSRVGKRERELPLSSPEGMMTWVLTQQKPKQEADEMNPTNPKAAN
jgi:hypothetical protein